MLLTDLFENKSRKVLAIFSGGFHPFHAGHASVYQYLKEKFPMADVFVASSNKTSERPFAFKDKQFLASQAGIPSNRFVEVVSPYKSMEITSQYDPDSTILIFALSEKDKDRLGKPYKKDGTPSYMQPYPGSIDKCVPFSKHGYYVVTPVLKFSVLGQKINSASQIREMYKNADDQTRMKIAHDLYPKSSKLDKVKAILDEVLGSHPITEFKGMITQKPTQAFTKDGWITPQGKLIENDNWNGHIGTVRRNGYKGYADAYLDGWVHFSISDSGTVAFLKTYKTFKNIEPLLDKIVPSISAKYPDINIQTHDGIYEWNGRDFRLMRRFDVYESTEPIKDATAAGWVTPDNKFIRNTKPFSGHLKTLEQYKLGSYLSAYKQGWIRISLNPSHTKFYIETNAPLAQEYDRLVMIAKAAQSSYGDIRAYLGEGPTYGEYIWDGKEFNRRFKNELDEHIVKLKSGKYRLLSKKGKNLGTFGSHKAAAKHEGEVEWFKSH